MISLDDCIAMCGLTREEVDAIAEHEHIDEMDAAALADHLMSRARGARRVHEMIRDDIRAALARGHEEHAAELLAALRHFVKAHPESVR